MSDPNHDAEEIMEERGGFFIAPSLDSEWDEDDVDHQMLILKKADALASENRLKEAIDVFSMALRYGSIRSEQLSTLVDCILRNFKKKIEEVSSEAEHKIQLEKGSTGDFFNCPGCHMFLSEPVTIACGHSYCKRCLDRKMFSKCKLCGDNLANTPGELRPNVILNNLVQKWFPEEIKRSKIIGEVGNLTKRKLFQEAVTLSNKLIKSDPGDIVARACRAEAYTGLKQFSLALADMDAVWMRSTRWPEGYFRKAKILLEMGQVDDSLQVFLQCLTLDDDFTLAKKEVEKILCELMSPACDNVEVGLQETSLNTSPGLRAKAPVAVTQPHEGQDEAEPEVGQVQAQDRPGLSRAQSMRTAGRACCSGSGTVFMAEEGLKRVQSAPQLGDQDKGALLKRKLSASEAGPSFVPSGGSKHKKQGEAVTCRSVPAHLLEASDFECSLCMRLFYEPVTTPCGHTFCRSCLERCLDHTPQCPLCKESLRQYLASRRYKVTQVLDDVIRQCLPAEHLDRQRAHVEETKELSDLTRKVPVFVCTMAYPTVPCPLHVFEPRYRLMIRRCMETGTRQFGMCIDDPQKGFVDYGCMLQIRSVHFLPDGRSVVDTVGGRRFRVLSRGMRDGYCIADIEYLADVKVEDSQELTKLQELHDQVYEQACTWFQNLKNRFRCQILQHFGPMPEREADIQATPDGPACCWWLLAVLPVDPRYQLSVLSMLSLRERLLKIQHILTYLQSMPGD